MPTKITSRSQLNQTLGKDPSDALQNRPGVVLIEGTGYVEDGQHLGVVKYATGRPDIYLVEHVDEVPDDYPAAVAEYLNPTVPPPPAPSW